MDTNYITIKQAREVLTQETGLTRTPASLIEWIRKHGLGKQIGGKGGPWLVDPVKFKEHINAENTPDGESNHPD